MFYSLNSQHNSGAHPTLYSVDSHRSFSGDKVVVASSCPLISILCTKLQRLKLRTSLPDEHTHSSTPLTTNARGEPAGIFVTVSPCILSCTSACQYNLASACLPADYPAAICRLCSSNYSLHSQSHINPPALPKSYTTSPAFKPRTCNRLF